MEKASDLTFPEAARHTTSSRFPFHKSRLLVGAALLLLIGAVVAYQFAVGDRVVLGVSVGGVGVGGSDPSVAREALQRQATAWEQTIVTFSADQRQWSITLADLGWRWDVQRALDQALLVGHDGHIGQRLVDQAAALVGARQLPWEPHVDEERGRSFLQGLAAELERDPVPARLDISADLQVKIVPETIGRRLDVEAAWSQLLGSVRPGAALTLELPTVPIEAPIRADEMEAVRAQAQALLARPVVLRAEEVSREIAPADLADALDVTATPGGGATLVLKEAVLRQLVETFARAVDRAPVDASVAIAEGPEVVVSEDVAGRRVDVESTAAALRSALLNGSHGPVTATIETLPPRVTRSDVAPIAARIERMIGSPLTLEAQGKRLALDPSSLAELVVVDAPEGEVPSVGVDRAAVEAVVERFAASVYRPPRDARFTLDGGKLQVSSPEEPGVRLDTATSIDLVAEALVSDRRVVQLPVATIQPKITRATIAELNDAKVVGEASTPMRGVPEKLHNIRLAASRLDGVVVPPGEVFSFNSSLGPTTLESGFKTAWGILTTKDGLRTVPSVAGGICQVATTLFQAAFWAGYPIEQRYHHSYWIPSYASRGYVGLDATVDADYGLDFKFSNPTEHPILIRAAATGDRLTFSLYSVDPGWQVEVQKPIVTNVVPADKKVYEEPDPNMPQGQRLWIEAAHDGFTSTIVRIVRSAEGEQTTKIVSHYAPARNVVRVGTKVVAPEQPTTAQPADGTETPEGSRQSSPGASAPASPSA